MKLHPAPAALLSAALCFAAGKPPPQAHGANDKLRLEATLYTGRDEIRRLLGHELEKGIVVVEVRLEPLGGAPLKVWHEDFILRSDKDGQKSEPYDPGQIAGSAVLRLVSTYEGGQVMHEDRGPVWGGMGGRRPGRLPGATSGGFGNSAAVENTETRPGPEAEAAENPLLAALRAKLLEEKETARPLSGLLYFPLSGKHKPKQLWLHYQGEAGKLDLRFSKP